ncbi:hypothetical protein INR49_016446 [Caranx melampygus]|nr:hypothetical protein INR49_016446 [Caranx melampygus]
MIAAQAKLVYHLNKYYNEKCQSRKAAISKTIREVCKVVSDVLKEVEVQEPRFISSLSEMDNRFEGLEVISPTEFEVVLYLNQMGVFNFVDDGSLPGCAVLKLSDGRKRSMSLWVEFITASGYLSARKIRSRFQTLVAQAVDKCSYRDVVKMVADTSEVKLRIRDRYVVQITPAFKCTGIWPRSAAHWPLPHIPWPGPNRVAEVKAEGFNLLSKECYSLNGKQSSAESDAWVLQFAEAENRLLLGGCRKKCLSVLKALRDRHLELPGQPLNNYHMKTLVSYECEKHPRESDWDENCLGDRLNGILLQLISCLQCRRVILVHLKVDLSGGDGQGSPRHQDRGNKLGRAAQNHWACTQSVEGAATCPHCSGPLTVILSADAISPAAARCLQASYEDRLTASSSPSSISSVSGFWLVTVWLRKDFLDLTNSSSSEPVILPVVKTPEVVLLTVIETRRQAGPVGDSEKPGWAETSAWACRGSGQMGQQMGKGAELPQICSTEIPESGHTHRRTDEESRQKVELPAEEGFGLRIPRSTYSGNPQGSGPAVWIHKEAPSNGFLMGSQCKNDGLTEVTLNDVGYCCHGN